ncbi:hypothetical protein C8A01DRAFT_47879 [Parachaetomium inaequale]|uniref:NACHT domain-containing protein n=1 Tax=Parachaetomium inaequale TaxID=2588326 RepID=A0AAN6SPS8_9PEZI|nr:hypothetical protein C8A01DRAFT_47879 [Parachaetomium inaequale]
MEGRGLHPSSAPFHNAGRDQVNAPGGIANKNDGFGNHLPGATFHRAVSFACLRSLGFRDIDARLHDIAAAYRGIYDWLFHTDQFQKWRDRADLLAYNGVLWIKGKPGTGKSTLMKYALRHYKEVFADHLIVAYFFNARGKILEKTPLEDFIRSIINKRQSKPLLLLVDALDEYDDRGVRDIIGFLESLSIDAVQARITLRIYLSSRHYPNVKASVEYERDITIYVEEKLKGYDNEIKAKVVIVVSLLNKVYDDGRLEAIYEGLEEVPADVEEWVLLSQRPLKPEELFFAVLAGTAPEYSRPWDRSKITGDTMQRRITASSKGLIEARIERTASMQFIYLTCLLL